MITASGLREISMEKQWFALLDKLDEIGVPVYAVITPLEDAGVPTMWFTIGIIVILLGGMAVNLMPERTVDFDITVTRNGEALKGAAVSVNEQSQKTGSTGRVVLKVPYGIQALLTVTHPDCEKESMTLPTRDDYTASIELRCTA